MKFQSFKSLKTTDANPAGAGDTVRLVATLPILLELSAHPDAAVAAIAAQGVAATLDIHPEDGAAMLLSGDGIALACKPHLSSPVL